MPIPTVRATIVAPEPLLRDRGFLRIHNRCAKEALHEQGMHHWQVRIPLHFGRAARSKYGYMARSPKYIRYKQRRWNQGGLDLVKTGAMRSDMIHTPPVIRIGGKASDDAGDSAGLKLTLTMPMHIGNKAQAYYAALSQTLNGKAAVARAKARAATRAGVTIAQMRREIATINPDEAQDTARRFLRGYGQRLSLALARAPRIRKRVSQVTSGRA